MPLAELVLDSSPSNFESFYFRLTDQATSLVVLIASRDQFKRLREGLGEAPGLYVLQAEDSTVYVGQSKNLRDRLKTHRSTDKIKFRRVMAMYRDQGLSRYLDYAEARLYQQLREMGFRLDQFSLTSSLDTKKSRLLSLDKEHVAMVDGLIRQFLSYIVAIGLAKPMIERPPTGPAKAAIRNDAPAVGAEARADTRSPRSEARLPGAALSFEAPCSPVAPESSQDGPKAIVF